MDITKCSGEDCPVRDRCYRFTAEGDEFQTVFVDPPLVVDQKGVVSCEMFWGEGAQNIFENLKKICGGGLDSK